LAPASLASAPDPGDASASGLLHDLRELAVEPPAASSNIVVTVFGGDGPTVSENGAGKHLRAHAAAAHRDAMSRLVAELRLATTVEEVTLIEARMSGLADEYYAALRATAIALRAKNDQLPANPQDRAPRRGFRRTFIDVDSV
jgi:hypothetical protein